MVAAESGQKDAVKELISLGASLDLQNIVSYSSFTFSLPPEEKCTTHAAYISTYTVV